MKRKLVVLVVGFLLFSSKISAAAATDVCSDLPTTPVDYKTACETCVKRGGGSGTWVWTAVGCLNAGEPVAGVPGAVGPSFLIGQILSWSTILGSGIAFLLILLGAFQITTASGDPKKMKAAQELISSAIMGLLLIIFSIFLLNIVGFKILNLGAGGLGVFGTPNP